MSEENTLEAFARARMDDAVRRRDEWIAARILEIAPSLADVPERTTRFLQSVQRMLAATNPREAGQYAAEVVTQATTVALLRVEYARVVEHLAARAPLEFSVPVQQTPALPSSTVGR